MKRHYNQLPQVAFSILLALSLKPRHGYEIIKQVEDDSRGKVSLSSGALYTSIKQLHDNKFIEELSLTNDPRRRYYRLTDGGRAALNQELEYYRNSLELAGQRQIFPGQHA